MFTVWYDDSSGQAKWLEENTVLDSIAHVDTEAFDSSDANAPRTFHEIPPRIKQLLRLDAPDLILTNDRVPILMIEISTEAGTGHNPLQRFSRLANSVRNGVPAFYIFPQAKWTVRKNSRSRWDQLNPMVFYGLEMATRIHGVPAIHFYYPSEFEPQEEDDGGKKPDDPKNSGLKKDHKWQDAPDRDGEDIRRLFECVDMVIQHRRSGQDQPLRNQRPIQNQRSLMQSRCGARDGFSDEWSPSQTVEVVPTSALVDYISNLYSGVGDSLSHLSARDETVIYYGDIKVKTSSRDLNDDPYIGALSVVDYVMCRTGASFLDRDRNLVFAFGDLESSDGIEVQAKDDDGCSIERFTDEVSKVTKGHNPLLLNKGHDNLSAHEIPRYFMHVQHGSKYSLNKGIRCFAYPADAILFHDGALWRSG